MKETQLQKRLELAENSFYRGEYEEAMRHYGLVLKDHPDSKEAKIGAILTDIAIENDEEGQALFEYYQVLKSEENEEAEAIIESMIDSFDGTLEKISQILEGALNLKEEPTEGIGYEDFKELVALRGSFRRAFEDIMFSTRVVITEKEDLLDFINRLVDNGFDEMALRYIEGAAVAFPAEEKIRELIDKLKESK
ncbi:MAG: hypothetical protein GXO33_06150 [Epsilonproteobacteria bacterium]|nr:hypothetical protein [Campylobacterota bacterium]